MYRRRAGQRRRNAQRQQPALHGPFHFAMPPPHVQNQRVGMTRLQLHAAWNQAAAHGVHWDMGEHGFDGAAWDIPFNQTLNPHRDRPGREQNNGRFRTWDPNAPGDPMALNPLLPQVNLWPINQYRQEELTSLQEKGDFVVNSGIIPPGGAGGYTIIEPRWMFCGIIDENSPNYAELGHLSPNWSIFKYVLSDLMTNGHQFGSDLVQTMQAIVCDIISIAGPTINENSGCMVYFQGEYDVGDGHLWGGNKPWLFYTDRGFRLGDILENPDELLGRMGNALRHHANSNDFISFQFYRVYVPVLTELPGGGGGTLDRMPEDLKVLRNGPHFKGRKGYILINNENEMCGFLAFLAGFANITARIKKAYKVLKTQAPSICGKLLNYNSKIINNTKSGKSIQAEFLLEMMKCIDYKQGSQVRPDELCIVARFFRETYKIDFGLVIFDALCPLKHVVTSYDVNDIKIPAEKLCLIHWKFGLDNQYGHYDCVYATNLASWLYKGAPNRKNLVFCFRSLKMISNNETSEKGKLCPNCGFFEKEILLKMGSMEKHGPITSFQVYFCEKCEVKFKSEECYQYHKIKPHGLSKPACIARKKCETCKKIHGSEYDCKSFFCHICRKKFPVCDRKGHVCYIQHTSAKKQEKLENVIYADCEGTRMEGYHTAVCLAAAWKGLCKKHMKVKRCEICKSEKDKASFERYCEDCKVIAGMNDCDKCQKSHSKFFLENCINNFLDWVEDRFGKATIVFHNGGRYDMHLVYLELLKSGKFYVKREAERGTQIIFMVASLLTEERKSKTVELRFIDSYNFIAASLRHFPQMFNIDSKILSKGHFPYDLLNEKDWIKYEGICPDFQKFGITLKELENIDSLNPHRRIHIEEILEYIKIEREKKEPWKAFDKLKEYTLQDVYVLQAGCDDFRYNFWKTCHTDPFHWVTLAAAIAGTYRQDGFMHDDSIQVFNIEAREWQRKGLRGGRCEAFKLYWKAKSDAEEMKIYDVNSEYPAAQMYAYAPLGAITFEKKYEGTGRPLFNFLDDIKREYKINFMEALLDPTGKSGNGMIECEVKCAYSRYPILPLKEGKNLFKVMEGVWHGYICVLAEAIVQKQVIVKNIRRIQYWHKTTNKLFRNFIAPVYASKVHATGWKKLLGKDANEEEKRNFVNESNARGIPVVYEEIKENPGQRNTCKVSANCGWGYLCQKPHANEILYFHNESEEDLTRMKDVLLGLNSVSDPRRLTNKPQGVGQYTRLKLTKAPENITEKEMNVNIAYHVGGLAPAWGLQLISKSILKLHPSQPAYTDTDSIFYTYNSTKPEHKKLPTGYYLGDFVDEYPDHRIVEFVCIGPKSYFIKMVHRQTGQVTYKGRFKGLPTCSSTYSLLNEDEEIASFGMRQMKEILYSAYIPPGMEEPGVDAITLKFRYTNFFKRGQDLKIKSCIESKTVQFTFDKRLVLWPDEMDMDNWHEVNTLPICDSDEPLQPKDVEEYWEVCK